MSNRTRVVMLGTKDFAVPTFAAILDRPDEIEVLALITQPDKPQGRKQEIITSPIKALAVERGLRVEQPESINSPEGVALLRSLAPDLLVTAAYGQILSSEVLGIPKFGGINLHGSILPKYRGAAPVARGIQHGETTFGVTVIQMNPKVDAGGMLQVATTPVDPDETAAELEARLAVLGAPLIPDAIHAIATGTAKFLPQDATLATRAPKLKKEDGLIDWNLPASIIHNLIRAMNPWPLCSTTWHKTPETALRLIIHETRLASDVETTAAPGEVIVAEGDRFIVATGEGALQLVRVQLEGKKPATAQEFLRGHKAVGTRLS